MGRAHTQNAPLLLTEVFLDFSDLAPIYVSRNGEIGENGEFGVNGEIGESAVNFYRLSNARKRGFENNEMPNHQVAALGGKQY